MTNPNVRPDLEAQFYIVDLRRSFRGDPCVTVWRPENGGYAYPLSWAGRYGRAQVAANLSYYAARKEGRHPSPDRFPVPCEMVERLAVPTPPRMVDGDAGPVVRNTTANKAKLRRWGRAAIATLSQGTSND